MAKRVGFFQGCRSAAQLHGKEKERDTLLASAEEQNIKISRINADRSIEENELAYLKADLADIDELLNQKSGPDYLKMIADIEEARAGSACRTDNNPVLKRIRRQISKA